MQPACFSMRAKAKPSRIDNCGLPRTSCCARRTHSPGQVHYLEAAANERLFLSACEIEKLVLEQDIRDENLIRQLQKASSSDAFLRSMRQPLSLTIILIRLLRPFQTGLDLGHRQPQKLGGFAQ